MTVPREHAARPRSLSGVQPFAVKAGGGGDQFEPQRPVEHYSQNRGTGQTAS